MAKWGEGDPRWIVEDRPDATNVNNWHWTEKNASQWSKDKIKELFTNLVIEDEKIGKCVLTEVSSIEGEASASNRKGKLIFFYEWVVQMKWIGKLNGSDSEVEGKLDIPNLSEENTAEEVDVNVSLSNDTENGTILKEMMRLKGTQVIRVHLAQYIKDLKEEFSVGMILPKKGEAQSVDKPVARVEHVQQVVKQKLKEDPDTSRLKNLDISGIKIDTVKLKLKQTFKCTGEEFYRVMTEIEMVQAFTRGPCKLEPVKNGKFELFGGNVIGEFTELVPYTQISQKWRFKQWPAGHFSKVTLTIDQKDDCTEVSLVQTGVPQSELDNTRDGWNHYYWESMKKTFGFGALLL